MKLQVVSLLVAIISLAFAGPIDNGKDTCAHTCTETYKFGYRPGITYEFDYKVKTSTGLQGTLDGSSALEVTATVLVEALSKCNFILKVENTQLYEIDLRSDIKRKSEGSKRFKDDLEQHELKFSFQNGIIDRICASPNESIWVLNVKRGILSVFQNSMENFNQDKTLKESDVTGTCDTEYTVISSQQSGYVVKKTKNLLKCSGRHEIRTAMHGVPYGASTEFQSLPLMNSKHQCQQEISSDGLMNSARCVESHLFEPFSRKGKVTSTEIIQILEFVQETTPTATAQGIFTNHRTLLYEYGTEEPKSTVMDVETVLQQICKNTHTDIRPESTALFSKLVDKLQTLDIQSIKDVYRQLSDGRFCVQNPRVRKFFLDAIPLAGSTSALRFMTELIMTEDVTGPEANVLLTTLTFMQSPSKQMLQELTPLLSLRSGKALLPVSSLVHTYCRSTPCDGDVDIHSIMTALQNNIAAGCSVDEDNIRLTMLSLRAIGNTGQPNQTVQIINSCLARSENPIEVRLAAIDAFRQFPCEITRSHLLMMFTNMTEDPELRITAYLTAIKCADTDTIDIINTTLEVEQVNQVGSFVLSHLTNLNETSNRHKQGIRNILSTFQLGNKFNLDKTKFSHNFEKSIFLQQYNIGSSFESNVVWTPSSFVPRSMSANLTIDLFGRSVNLLDIGGRFEGLDTFLESYFGPNGYFSDGAGNDFARQITKSMTFKKMMDIGSKLPRVKKVKGAFYVRVFGQELGYTTLSEGTSIFGEEFNILEMLISMSKNQEYTKTQNVQFLDSRFSVPTCAGFPLSLTVNGVVSIDVKVSGKMDIRKLITSPRSVSINGAIQPSAALEISGSMTLDAFVTRSGIQAVSNIHTSTVLQGTIEYVEGRNVDLELDMPREKIEIVNFKTAFFLIKNDSHREEIIITKNKQSQRLCTGDLVSTLSGLQLCSELEFLNTSLLKDVPPFLQAGSSNIKIHLLKMDNMSGYKLAARFIKTRQAVTAHLEVNSPGSEIDRRIGADFAMDKIDPSFTLNIFSPWKKATFNGALQNSRSLRRVFGRLSLDSSHDYYVNAELLRSRRGHSIIYTPTLELRLPIRDPIRLEGKIVYLPFKTIDIDMMLSGTTTSPVTTKVTLHSKSMIRSILASISFEPGKMYRASAGLHKISSNRAVKFRPYMYFRLPEREVFIFDGSAEYRAGRTATVGISLRKIFKENVSLFYRVRKIGSAKNKRYETKVDIASAYMKSKIQSSVVVRDGRTLVTRSSIDYIIPTVISDKITINGKGNVARSKYLTEVMGTLNVQFKKRTHYNTDVSLDITHNARNTKVGIDVRYGEDSTNTDRIVTLSTTVIHRLTWSEPTLSVNSTYRHPAKDIALRFLAGHTHNDRSLESSISYMLNNAEPFSLTIRLKKGNLPRKTRFGSLLLSYRGRIVKVGNDLFESDNGVYTNKMTAEWEPRKKNTISAIFRMPSKRQIRCAIDVNFADFSRVRFSGSYLMDITNMSATSELSLAGRKYTLSNAIQFENEGRETILTTSIKFPSTHLVLEANFLPRHPLYTVRTNAMWTVSNNPERRLHLLALFNVENMGFSVSKTSPLGQLETDFNQHGNFNFRSHIHIQWGFLKGVVINGTFRNDGINENIHVKGVLTIQSRFRGYRVISMTNTYISDRERYLTNFNVHTKSGKKLAASFTIRKPITLSYVVGEISLKSTLKNFQILTLECMHVFERGLSTMTKFFWNRNSIQVNLRGFNTWTRYLRDISGTFAVKSTFPSLDSIIITGKHADDGRRFNSNFRLLRNGYGITYKGGMIHEQHGWQMLNSGHISCAVFSRKFRSSWNHSSTPSDIITRLHSTSGKRSLKLEFSSGYALSMERGTFYLRSTQAGNILPNVELFAEHMHNRHGINNTFTLRRRTKLMFSTVNQMQLSDGSIDSSHTAQVMNKVYLMKTEARYRNHPYLGLVEFQWPNKEKIHVSYTWNKVNGLYDGLAAIHSPNWKNIDVSFQQAFLIDELTSTINVNRKSNRIFFLENRFRWDDIKSIYIEVSTHYRIIRTFDGHVILSGNLKKFQVESNMGIQYRPNKHINLEIMLSNIAKIEGRLLLRIPQEEDILFVYLQNEHPTNIHMELQYHPRKRFETDLLIELGENTEIVILGKTPFTKDLVGIIRHSAFPSSFVSHTEIKYGFSKILFADASLGWKKNITGTLALKSAYIENINAGFYYQWSFRYFKTQWEYQRRSKIIFDGDIELRKDRTFTNRAMLSLTVPGLKQINAALSHRGRLTRFNTNANLKYGNKKLNIIAEFTVDPNLYASFQIATPLKGYKTLHASIHHEGSRKYFNTKTSFGIGKSNIVGTARFTMIPISIELNLQTPFAKYKQRKLFYTHTGSIAQFQCQAEILYNSKQLFGDIQLSLKPLTGTLSLRTPFVKYETVTMKLSHEKKNGYYQTFLDVNLPRERTLTVSANLDLSVIGTRSASITIITPYKNHDKIEAGISFTGSIKKFECRSLLGIGKKQVIGFARFDLMESIGGEIAFMTPFVGYRRVSVGFQYVGASINFKLRTEVMIVDSAYEMELTYSALSDYEALLVLHLPNTEDIRLSALISKTRRQLVTEAALAQGRTSLANAKLKCNLTPTIQGSGTFKSKWTKPAKLTLSHEGSVRDFQTVVRLDYDMMKIILDTNLEIADEVTGRLTFKSPFTSIEQVDATIFHSPRKSTYRYNFQSGSNSEKATAIHLTADLRGRKDIKFDVMIPIYEMKRTIVVVNYTNESNNLQGLIQMTVGQEALECNLAVNVSNGIVGQVMVKTPWYNDINGGFMYSGSVADFQSHAELNYSGTRQFRTDLIVSVEPRQILVLSIDMPLSQVRHIECNISQSFALEHISSEVDFAVNENRLAGVIDFDIQNGIDARGSLVTSFTEDVVIVFVQNGTVLQMQSYVELMHGDMQQTSISISYDFPSAIHVNVSLHTDFELINDLQILINHDGGITDFRSSGLCIYNTNRKLEYLIKIVSEGERSGLIIFESPFSPVVNASFETRGRDYVADLYYNEVELVFAKLSVSNYPDVEGSLLMRTATERVRNINVSATIENKQNMDIQVSIFSNGHTSNFEFMLLNNLSTNCLLLFRAPISEIGDTGISFSSKFDIDIVVSNAEIYYADNVIACDLEMDFRNKTHVFLETRSQFLTGKNISGTFEYSNTEDQVSNHISLRVSPLQMFESNVEYLSINNFSVGIVAQSHLAGYEHISLVLCHVLSHDYVKSHAEISRQLNEKFQLEMVGAIGNYVSGQLSIATPIHGYEETSIDFRNRINSNSFTLHANLEHNKKIFLSNISLSFVSANVTLQTPLMGYEYFDFAFNHDIKPDHFLLLLTASRDIDNPYGINIDMDFPTGVIYIQTPISGYEYISAAYMNNIYRESVSSHIKIVYASDRTIELTLNCSLHEGSLVLQTPIVGYENMSVSFLNIHTNTLLFNKAEISLYNGVRRGYSIDINHTSPYGFEANVFVNALLPRLESFNGSIGLQWTRSFLSYAELEVSVGGEIHEFNMGTGQKLSSDYVLPADKADRDILSEDNSSTILFSLTTKRNDKVFLDFVLNKDDGCLLSLQMRKPFSIQVVTCVNNDHVHISNNVVEVENYMHADYNMTSSLSVLIIIEGVTLFRIQQKTSENYDQQTKARREHLLLQVSTLVINVHDIYNSDKYTTWNKSMEIFSGGEVKFRAGGIASSQQGSATLSLTLMLPEIGKEYEMHSSVISNSGNAIFDGEIGLRISEDEANHVVIYSRLEDDSTSEARNLSFVAGMKHPMTTMDIKMLSHIGYINDVYFTGTEFQYLSTDNDNKDISFQGIVNCALTEAAFEMTSPIKSIKVSAHVNTDIPYGLSLRSIVDEQLKVLELNFDPTQPHIDGRIEIPPRVISLELYFINDSYMRAAVDSEYLTGKINDLSVTTSLHSSRIIKTRINWRRDLFPDITAYGLQLSSNFKISVPFRVIGNSVTAEIDSKYNSIRRHILAELTPILMMCANKMLEMKESITAVKSTIDWDYVIEDEHFNQETVEFILNHISQHYDTAMTSVGRIADLMDTSASKHVSWKDIVDVDIESGYAVLEAMQQKLGQKLATQIYLLNDRLLNDSISVLQHFDYVRETALTMTDLIDYEYTAFLRKWSNVITVIDTISSITESNVIMTSEHLSRVIDDLKSTGVIMYDANNGFHETEIYVPIDLESLRSLPNVNFKNYVTGLTSSVESLREAASMVHNILVAGIKSWIPPFTASASISNGVIKTFDGTVYTVKGACNFLLAGDLTDGNFSVVMEVLDKKRTKFVISTQMHTIHLSPRKQVRIDGALIHIPYHSHDIYVTKFGDELIIAGNGFSLKYNRQTESYYFFLSGWYFGKTGGLLGTYDNEPYNDMLMATGDITNNIASFSKTWQLNDHCI